jgi:hypothetical protein
MWQLDGKRYWKAGTQLGRGTRRPRRQHGRDVLERRGKRGELTLFRQKKFGLWQSLSWNEVGAIVREAGMGLIELGFEVGETASILGNTRQEWLFSDLARALLRRRQLGHLPDRCGEPGRIPDAGFELGADLRRGRRAARQGCWKCASACRCCAASWSGTWRACASCTTNR